MPVLPEGRQVEVVHVPNAAESRAVISVGSPDPIWPPVGVVEVEYRLAVRALADMRDASPASHLGLPEAVPSGALALEVGVATV
jgi:hypothetical protein